MDKGIKRGIEWAALIVCIVTAILFVTWSGYYTDIMLPLSYGLASILTAIVWAALRIERVCARMSAELKSYIE
jgi:hypothetical protein